MSQLPTVEMFMETETHALGETDDVLDAIRKLIRSGITGAPVVDARGTKVVGMLTELECLKLLTTGAPSGGLPQGSVGEFMKTSITLLKPSMDIYYVAGLFLGTGYRRFAVVENDRLVGVITRKDLLKGVEAQLPAKPKG
jgi:CBS domain-containing protein